MAAYAIPTKQRFSLRHPPLKHKKHSQEYLEMKEFLRTHDFDLEYDKENDNGIVTVKDKKYC